MRTLSEALAEQHGIEGIAEGEASARQLEIRFAFGMVFSLQETELSVELPAA
ncbi:MAG: hypothetical protein OXH79_21750 [Boseongicola sp.]|nr:hypothetical protein [Boseongicola sp.]